MDEGIPETTESLLFSQKFPHIFAGSGGRLPTYFVIVGEKVEGEHCFLRGAAPFFGVSFSVLENIGCGAIEEYSRFNMDYCFDSMEWTTERIWFRLLPSCCFTVRRPRNRPHRHFLRLLTIRMHPLEWD